MYHAMSRVNSSSLLFGGSAARVSREVAARVPRLAGDGHPLAEPRAAPSADIRARPWLCAASSFPCASRRPRSDSTHASVIGPLNDPCPGSFLGSITGKFRSNSRVDTTPEKIRNQMLLNPTDRRSVTLEKLRDATRGRAPDSPAHTSNAPREGRASSQGRDETRKGTRTRSSRSRTSRAVAGCGYRGTLKSRTRVKVRRQRIRPMGAPNVARARPRVSPRGTSTRR